jgi:hypothetical protein
MQLCRMAITSKYLGLREPSNSVQGLTVIFSFLAPLHTGGLVLVQ